MLRFIRTAGLAFAPAFLMASPAMAAEYQCRLDDSAVRIAIEVKKNGHTLPCEVIAEDDRDERAVLYSARYDRNYCPDRLEKTRAELEGEGWVCQKTSDRNVVQGQGKLLPRNELAASEPASDTSRTVAVSDNQTCRFDGKTRRLKIEVEDPDDGKPCSLIYWSENDEREAGEVLWRAEHDAEFCPKRMSFIVEKWTNEGWLCGPENDTTEAAVLPEKAAPSAPLPVGEVTAETSETPEVTETPETPETPVALEPSVSPAPEKVAEKPVEPAEPDLELLTVIEADAKRIGEWMEVEPGVEIAAYGDLNADGLDDAVIFLAYQSDQSAYRQYLMSYLLADETYELAGVKLLTGVNPPPGQAKVEEISEGVIWLSLSEGNGDRADPVGYKLRNQQLVEIDTSEEAQSASN